MNVSLLQGHLFCIDTTTHSAAQPLLTAASRSWGCSCFVCVLGSHRISQTLAEQLTMHLQDTEWIVVVGAIAAFLNSVTIGDSRGLYNEHNCCLQ